MKLSIISGARPNFMKIAPVAHAIEHFKQQGKQIDYRLIYTGTQQDADLGASLFADLQIKAPDACLDISTPNAIEAAARTMIAFDKELKENPADVVLIVDDLTVTMSCTIVAKKHGAKVAHIAAGTRSFNPQVEKEENRVIIDGLSDFHFTAGMVANRNLSHTGTEREDVFFVGNVLIDTLRANRKRLVRPLWFDSMNLEEGKYLLLTINRHHLLRDKANFENLMRTVVEYADNMPIIAPLHTYVSEAIAQCDVRDNELKILPPQSYLAFGYLLEHAKGVITDSGNVAEEATFLGVPCITLNRYAEHPETVNEGTNVLVGESPEALKNALSLLITDGWKSYSIPERWDGHAAERIVRTLLERS